MVLNRKSPNMEIPFPFVETYIRATENRRLLRGQAHVFTSGAVVQVFSLC